MLQTKIVKTDESCAIIKGAKLLLAYPEICDDEQFGFLAVCADDAVRVETVAIEEESYGLCRTLSTIKISGGPIRFLKKHPIDNLFVALDENRRVAIVDISRGREVLSYKVEEDLELNFLSVHPDGKLVALSGTNGQVHFLDLCSGEILTTVDCQKVKPLETISYELGRQYPNRIQSKRIPPGKFE